MKEDLGHPRRPLSCGECGAPLAHDQRYCVACGARRGSLPAHLSNLLAAVFERGRRVRAAGAPPIEAQPSDPTRFDAWLRTPRAAAVAVISMLGFGVVVGSLVGGSSASPLAPLIVEESPSASAGPGPGPGGGSASAAASGDTSITVTSTAAAPASAAPVAASATSAVSGSNPTSPLNRTLPSIRHVFLLVLSNQGYNQTFAHKQNDPYLAQKLTRQGELLVNYYAVAGSPLANEVAMSAGQGPNPDTASDCPRYTPFISSGFGAQGQQLGSGCVYPTAVPSLADQLVADKHTWKAYLQTRAGQRRAGTEECHPRPGSSQGSSPTPSHPYATWRNPFMFFRSLTTAACPKEDVPLRRLATDLRRTETTPALAYIVADACHDGSDTPCAPNARAGMGPADQFLKSVVPEIERSPAYKDHGLIAITFDEAPQTGPNADSSSCCANPAYPNMQGPSSSSTTTTSSTAPTTSTTGSSTTATSTAFTSNLTQALTTMTSTAGSTSTTASSTTGSSSTTTTTTGASTATSDSLGAGQTNPTGGGGQVGLLLISRFVKPGALEVTGYFNHFSLLASLEQLFALPRLGYAADPALPVFGASVWRR